MFAHPWNVLALASAVLLVIHAAADVLALTSLEVDPSGIEEGQTVTVKWRRGF
jgi:Rieske Fe-S protein